jgi:hypothetical protein
VIETFNPFIAREHFWIAARVVMKEQRRIRLQMQIDAGEQAECPVT